MVRNKLKFRSFLNKRTNTNPKKGPIHFRAPSRMLWRTVRGMLPHKLKRGASALERLKVRTNASPRAAPRAQLGARTASGPRKRRLHCCCHLCRRPVAPARRAQVFDGCPPPYDKTKRVVVPDALRVTRLAPGRKFCVLGDLAKQCGWKYGDLVDKLEEKRKAEAADYYKRKKASIAAKKEAAKSVTQQISKVQPILEQHGFA